MGTVVLTDSETTWNFKNRMLLARSKTEPCTKLLNIGALQLEVVCNDFRTTWFMYY